MHCGDLGKPDLVVGLAPAVLVLVVSLVLGVQEVRDYEGLGCGTLCARH